MGSTVLITGTDTEVGKTHVGCALLKSALSQGIRAFALKPVETGCRVLQDGTLVPEDAVKYKEVLGDPELPISRVCLYMYEPPLSPNIAARISGHLPDIELIKESIQNLSKDYELILVEGAGGLLVEIIDGYHFADLAEELHMELLMVAPDRLGVINQVALNLEYIRARNLKLMAIILNRITDDPQPARNFNKSELKRRFHSIPIYGDVEEFLNHLKEHIHID